MLILLVAIYPFGAYYVVLARVRTLDQFPDIVELQQFELNNVWELVKCPAPCKHSIIGTKWIYRNKQDEHGKVVRNKAHLVAQG